MNKKIKIILGIIIGLVITILLVLLVININKDKKEAEENMKIINKNYQELTINVKEYNKNREELSNKISNLYYDTYKEVQPEYFELITKYNDNMIKIDKNIYQISVRCNNIYKSSDINEICSSYKLTYEKLVNLYVGDLKNLNSKVSKYNELYNENEGLYEMVHIDYIDYNENGAYEGKTN